MTQGVLVVMQGDFRIAGGAGGEEHQHRIVAAGGVFFPGKILVIERVFLVKVVPAFPVVTDDNLGVQSRAVGSSQIHLVGRIAVSGTDDGADTSGVKTIFKVVLNQLVCRRDCDGAQFVQAQNAEPELVVPFEHQHNPVAPGGCPVP